MRTLIALLLLVNWLPAADPVANPSTNQADLGGDWSLMRGMTPRGYVCNQASAPPTINGRLDDSAWQAAAWTEAFVDIQGDRQPKPLHATRAKMLWDDQHFYIAAELTEPHVWGTLTKHDAVIFQDNDFELFVDPDGDNHQYFEFELNALNTTWDLFLPKPYKDGGSADNSWEIAGLRSAVHVDGSINNPADTDRGWFVELAIPWAAFQHKGQPATAPKAPQAGDTWRVNFSRVQWQHEIVDGKYRKVQGTKEDNWVWSPPGIIDMHRPERWGFVEFRGQDSTAQTTSSNPASKPVARSQSTALSSLVVRDRLMAVYHHQRSYQAAHKKWATKLGDLGLPTTNDPSWIDVPLIDIQLTEDGYEATTVVQAEDGTQRRWHVRHDSRLWQSNEHEQIAEVLVRAGENAAQLTKALAGVTAREREGLEFLLIHMPDHDLRKLTADFLIENVHEAYVTLDAAPWKDSIPKEIFFNNVLTYSSINERRDNWRKDFRQRFSPLIAEAKTAAHAAALLNQRLYPLVKVKYSTQRKKADQSPYESINSGLASCTGLSVLLIDACRAVGVPARFVGTPLWSDGSGNHSWLEVWDNGWHFTGAAEPNGDDLDKAWFLDRAAAAQRDVPKHAIYAVSYARTPLKFPMVWARDADYIYAVNITDRYVNLAVKPPAGSMKVMIRVRDQLTGQRVPAKLTITMDGSDQPAQSMVANDEGFDANDHIGLIVPVGKKLRIEATLDERTKAVEVVADANAPLLNISL